MKKYFIIICVLFAAIASFAQSSSNSKSELLDINFSLSDVDFPLYIYKDSSVIVKGYFKNMGVKPIESIDITYQVDGKGYEESFTLSNVHVETGDKWSFYHDLPLTITETGVHTLTVMLSIPNGTDSTTINSSVEFSVIDIENEAIRKVLVEEFSTEKCVNCPTVAAYLHGIVEEEENVILMTHHVGYGTDDYTIDESVEIKTFYNGGAWAPAAMMDRHYNGLANDSRGIVNPGPVFWPTKPYGGNRIYDRMGQLSYVDVNIAATYNEETSIVSVDVSGIFKANFTDQLGVSVWIIEDGNISNTQAGAFGQDYEQHGVVRAVLSETLGDSIKTATLTGNTYSASYQYTIPNDYVDRNISVIAFVNHIHDSINERSILNANQFELNSLMNHFKSTITVTNKNSEPVINATITIDDEDSYTTDENGNIELLLLDDTYSYTIEKYGYEDVSGEFTIADKDVVVAEELVSKVKTIFKVTNIDNAAIARVDVIIADIDTHITDNEGETAFMLSANTYSYTIDADGYDEIAGEFTLTTVDSIINIVLIETETFSVSFDVVEANGDNIPVEGAAITIEGDATYITNENGDITFDLEAAAYNYTVEKEGYKAVSGEFTVTNQDTVVEIGLRALYNVTFNVIDADSTAVYEASVAIEGEGTYETDLSGELTFSLEEGAIYNYIVTKEGYDTVGGEFTLVKDTLIQIGLSENDKLTFNITFNVSDDANTPVDGASVTIEGGDTFVTDENGEITFALEPATYNYMIVKEGYATVSDEFTLESKDETIDISLSYVSSIQSEQILVNVYPNPANNVVNIISDQAIQRVTVSTLQGRLVYDRWVGESRNVELNTSDYEPGIYMIKVKSAKSLNTEIISIIK